MYTHNTHPLLQHWLNMCSNFWFQVYFTGTKSIYVLDVLNFYSKGSTFSQSFHGLKTADDFLEEWEKKTRYNPST